MSVVDIRELSEETEDLIRRVDEDGETIAIMRRGRVAALIVRSSDSTQDTDEQPSWRAETEAAITELDRLTDEIAKVWPEGVSATDAVNDVRRDY